MSFKLPRVLLVICIEDCMYMQAYLLHLALSVKSVKTLRGFLENIHILRIFLEMYQ